MAASAEIRLGSDFEEEQEYDCCQDYCGGDKQRQLPPIVLGEMLKPLRDQKKWKLEDLPLKPCVVLNVLCSYGVYSVAAQFGHGGNVSV